MSLLEAIILGIIQGATEFLPVSSSGHLAIIPALTSLPTPGLTVSAIAHLGTLLAVLIYFWGDVLSIIAALWRGLLARTPLAQPESRLGWYILVGTIPAALVGLALEDWFEGIFANPNYAAFFLLITAGLLILGEKTLSGAKDLGEMGWLDAIAIGFAQMLALFPGISRSGSAITAGLSRGLNRESAARYSFLLGMPAIAGAGLLSIFDLVDAPDLAQQMPTLCATFATAALVGYACIAFLLNWLKQRSLYPFAIYCVCLSAFYFIVTAL